MKIAVREARPPARQDADPFLSTAPLPLAVGGGTLACVLGRYHVERFAPDLYQAAGIAMPPHIRASVPKRQAEFLAGRCCAQAALARHGLGGCQVETGAFREPLWPAGLTGSITHTGCYAAALAAPAARFAGIGIDIEHVIDASARAALTALVASPAELDQLYGAAPEIDADHLLTLLFSAKESFFKAAFAQVKAYFDFDAVCFAGLDEQAGSIMLQVVQGLGHGLPQGQRHRVQFQYLDQHTLITALAL